MFFIKNETLVFLRITASIYSIIETAKANKLKGYISQKYLSLHTFCAD